MSDDGASEDGECDEWDVVIFEKIGEEYKTLQELKAAIMLMTRDSLPQEHISTLDMIPTRSSSE